MSSDTTLTIPTPDPQVSNVPSEITFDEFSQAVEDQCGMISMSDLSYDDLLKIHHVLMDEKTAGVYYYSKTSRVLVRVNYIGYPKGTIVIQLLDGGSARPNMDKSKVNYILTSDEFKIARTTADAHGTVVYGIKTDFTPIELQF